MRSLTRTVALSAFAGAALFAIFASADAPPDQYVPYSPQVTTIEDKQTHLLWQRIVSVPATDFATAQASCSASGERLPTYRELLTLVDEDPHYDWDPDAQAATERHIDPNAFPQTPGGFFWSMSPGSAQNPNNHKLVNFANGDTRDDEGSLAYVRCVVDVP